MDVNKDIIDLDQNPDFLNAIFEQLTLLEKNPSTNQPSVLGPSNILNYVDKNNFDESNTEPCAKERNKSFEHFNTHEAKNIISNKNKKLQIKDKVSLEECCNPFPVCEENKVDNLIKKEIDDSAQNGKIPCFAEGDANFENFNFCNINKIDHNKCVKIENDISFNNFDKATSIYEKEVSCFLKKEIDEGAYFLKAEQFTDSSSSDEDEIIERGKEKKENRSHKKKIYKIQPRISAEELDLQKRLHCSSGRIVHSEDNSSNAIFPHQTYTLSNNYIPPWELEINSPDSGYDTSISNGVCSPSPPIIQPSDQEKTMKINQIYNEIKSIAEGRGAQISKDSNKTNHLGVVIEKVINRLESAKNLRKVSKERTQQRSYFNLDNQNNNIDSSFEDILSELYKTENQNHVAVALQPGKDRINHSPCVSGVQQTLSYSIVENDAKTALRQSEHFNIERYENEKMKMLLKIRKRETSNKSLNIIDIDEREKYNKQRQTNLHSAVLEENVERIFCLIECLKAYKEGFFHINDQDVHGKTALDYAKDRKMTLLVNYLIENNAKCAIKC